MCTSIFLQVPTIPFVRTCNPFLLLSFTSLTFESWQSREGNRNEEDEWRYLDCIEVIMIQR